MSTFTENYNLIKPDEEDYYDVTDFNENMDTIDTLMAETETAMGKINEKIGLPEDTSNNTLFGCLNAGSSLLKSMQNYKIKLSSKSGSSTQTITTVDPDRCFVYIQRLFDPSSCSTSISYTLNSDSIEVTANNSIASTTYQIVLEFWIFELN